MKESKHYLQFLHDESGQDLIEYALIAGLIGLGTVIAMTRLTGSVKTLFTGVGNTLTNAT